MDTFFSITVTIGKNIGATPMPHQLWSRFQADVSAALNKRVISAPEWTGTEFHYGRGEYTNSDGVTVSEISCKITRLAERFNVTGIDAQLREIAVRYQQEDIAFTWGRSYLSGGVESQHASA